VRLPLTLAIMDGMSVGVGDEVYILPLSSVVESFQVQDQTIKTIGGSGRVVEVRDEYMPVIGLEDVFQVPRFDFEHVAGIMVVVEAEGGRVALLVDELLGQQQVVVKNLEANYRKVTDVSGATIMGDGRVALIPRHRQPGATLAPLNARQRRTRDIPMNLNNLKIGTRLALGFGLVLALLLAIVSISFVRLVQTRAEMDALMAMEKRANLADQWHNKTQLNITRTIAIAKAAGQPEIEAYFTPQIKATERRDQRDPEAGRSRGHQRQEQGVMAAIADKRSAYLASRGPALRAA
jgi:chemotaxis signal transduction protein